MTKAQRIEHKFGNAARALVRAQRGYGRVFGFIKTKTCQGLLPRYKRWKERLRVALLRR